MHPAAQELLAADQAHSRFLDQYALDLIGDTYSSQLAIEEVGTIRALRACQEKIVNQLRPDQTKNVFWPHDQAAMDKFRGLPGGYIPDQVWVEVERAALSPWSKALRTLYRDAAHHGNEVRAVTVIRGVNSDSDGNSVTTTHYEGEAFASVTSSGVFWQDGQLVIPPTHDSGHEKLPGDGHETARWRP